MNHSHRRFLVTRAGRHNPVVTIREVEPGTNAYEFTRKEAWELARKLGQPVNARNGERRPASRLEFMGLDQMTTDLGTVEVERKAPSLAPVVEVAPVTPAPVRKQSVPEGRYALVTGDGGIRFYKVDCPTTGRWAGYVFVKAMAGGESYPVRDRNFREEILYAIKQDVRGAALLYGREIGSCGICGRTLTDENSRQAGIGPVCAKKMGWS